MSLEEVQAKETFTRRNLASDSGFILDKVKSREDGETQRRTGDYVHVESDKFLKWKKENKHRLEGILDINRKQWGGK